MIIFQNIKDEPWIKGQKKDGKDPMFFKTLGIGLICGITKTDIVCSHCGCEKWFIGLYTRDSIFHYIQQGHIDAKDEEEAKILSDDWIEDLSKAEEAKS